MAIYVNLSFIILWRCDFVRYKYLAYTFFLANVIVIDFLI